MHDGLEARVKRVWLVVPVLLISIGLSACAVGDPQPPTDVTETGATLKGDVYSSADGDTEYWFRYGETAAYGNETSHGNVAISDDQAHPVSEPITGLAPGTTYHWQLCVNDQAPDRDICNVDHTFTTIAPATVVEATYATDVSATLNGEVRSSTTGQAEYWFEYGQSGALASRAATLNASVLTSETAHRFVQVDDVTPRVVSIPVSNLTPATTYDYRLCVDPPGDLGTACSGERTVTTGTAGPARSGIAFTSSRDGNPEIYAMDEDGGNQTRLTNNAATDDRPTWAPDGTKIAFHSNRGGNYDVWVIDSDGGSPTDVTSQPGVDALPAWSPDGSKIAFVSFRDGNAEIYVMDADGSNQSRLTNNGAQDSEPVWSPDGSRIAFHSDRDGNLEIYTMDADGSNQTRLTNNPAQDVEADWSPDGTKIVFQSTRTGNHQIFTMNADGGNQTNVPNGPGFDSNPVWSPDGTRIAFRTTTSNAEVLLMNEDGSNRTNLTNNSASDESPAWSPRTVPAPAPKVYIALGDSVTQVGSSTNQRYPERFFSYLQGAGAADVLHNIGESGQTSGGLNGGQLTSALGYINDEDTDTAVVSIDIGGNDILGEPSCNPPSASFNLTTCQSTLSQFSSNFDSTLDSLSAALATDPGTEHLMVMAYYNPWSGRSGEEATANKAEVALLGADRTIDCDSSADFPYGLNDRIACIGADHGAVLADAYPPFIGHGPIGDYMADTIHPNDTGHQVIANTFQAAFETP
jgi:Tol biopolymer transport system component/lysophospholipase L1-like esterase